MASLHRRPGKLSERFKLVAYARIKRINRHLHRKYNNCNRFKTWKDFGWFNVTQLVQNQKIGHNKILVRQKKTQFYWTILILHIR